MTSSEQGIMHLEVNEVKIKSNLICDTITMS